jgi:hypothetical protein
VKADQSACKKLSAAAEAIRGARNHVFAGIVAMLLPTAAIFGQAAPIGSAQTCESTRYHSLKVQPADTRTENEKREIEQLNEACASELTAIYRAMIGAAPAPVALRRREPAEALVWATTFPGGGQLYNREYVKAFGMFSLHAAGVTMMILGLQDRESTSNALPVAGGASLLVVASLLSRLDAVRNAR